MMWKYNNKEIFVKDDGKFYVEGNVFDTLENAKIAIDKENLSYYTFNTKDCNEMKDKLSQRELELLSQMARAIVYPNEQVATLDETLVGINVTPSFDVDLENFIIGSNHEVSNER